MSHINCPKNEIPDTPGLEPLTVDFALDRGIAVRGRLIDKTTGKPVRGHVYYHAEPDNPHMKDFADLNKVECLPTIPETRQRTVHSPWSPF